MAKSDESYHVVFVYNEHVRGYAGNRTRSMWPNKAKFDEVRHRYGPDKSESIVAEGITDEEADTLVIQTPMSARLAAARDHLVDTATPCGRVSMRGRMEATNLFLAAALDAKERHERGLD